MSNAPLCDLMSMADENYADFQRRLMPTVPAQCVLGVRVPLLREYARTFLRSDACSRFFSSLPHTYYDENMLHGILISHVRDFQTAVALTEAFLPYVDNWAVCDVMNPRVYARHTEELLPHIRRWLSSEHTYTCRFGIDMLMSYYLDEAFSPEIPSLVAAIKSEEYYVRMAAAWLFATALAKQWESTVPLLENGVLDTDTHNKTIRKAIESNRISDGRKEYLCTLKR